MLDFSRASSHSHNCTHSNAEDSGSTTNLYPSPQHSSPGHVGIIQEVMFECWRHVGEYFTFLVGALRQRYSTGIKWCTSCALFFFLPILHLSFECRKYVPQIHLISNEPLMFTLQVNHRLMETFGIFKMI